MRLRRWMVVVGLCGLTATACSNYRDDLDRAASHYNRNQYENAIALLQPLELDLDSLSDQERAQYAYYRGMSHFRLNQRREARHWLGVAAAQEKNHAGSIGQEEKQRVTEPLDDLNRAVFGLAETPADKKKPCKTDADCDPGQFCDADHCAKAPATEGEKPAASEEAPPSEAASEPEPAPSAEGACTNDADCSGTQVCKDGSCAEP